MRVAALTVAFGERRFIGKCVQQFQGFIDGHLVLVGDKPWQGGETGDDTAAIAEGHGAIVETGTWPGQAEQFNHGLEQLAEFDWVLIADADEFYSRDDVERLIMTLGESHHVADVVTAAQMAVYWKSRNWRILPTQTDNPAIAVRPYIRFIDKRTCQGRKVAFRGWMHHFSYARDDEEMLRKIRSFEHAHEFDTQRWYEKVWLPWTEMSTNLHPTVPPKFKQAVKNPAPDGVGIA